MYAPSPRSIDRYRLGGVAGHPAEVHPEVICPEVICICPGSRVGVAIRDRALCAHRYPIRRRTNDSVVDQGWARSALGSHHQLMIIVLDTGTIRGDLTLDLVMSPSRRDKTSRGANCR